MSRSRLILALTFAVVLNGCARAPTYEIAGGSYDRGSAQNAYAALLTESALKAGADQPVKLTFAPMPDYPMALRTARIEGVVVTRFTVDTTGRVSEVRTMSAAHQELAQASTDAVRQWRFEPIEKGGKPISLVFEIPFTFRVKV